MSERYHVRWRAGFSLAVIVGFVLFLSGCGTSKVGTDAVAAYDANPLTVVIPEGVSPQDLETAMVEALRGREWSIESRNPEAVKGRLNHRNYDATVTLRVNGPVIMIQNSAVYTDPHNGFSQPGVPLGWLVNLRNDLQMNLASVAHSS
jgi:hypothetical protein